MLLYSHFPRVLTRFSFTVARLWVAWARTHYLVPVPLHSPSLLYAGAGYLVGPIIGSTLWRVTHRRTMALIEARDREFHQHIVKNRVDPRAQSATNPVPDFYGKYTLTLILRHVLRRRPLTGEKIGSLHQYRQVGPLLILTFPR